MRFLLSLPLPLLLILCSFVSFDSQAAPLPWSTNGRLRRSADDSPPTGGSETAANSTVDYSKLTPDQVYKMLENEQEKANNLTIELNVANETLNNITDEANKATRDYEEKKKEWEKWNEFNKWTKAVEDAIDIISQKEDEIPTLNATIAHLEQDLEPFLREIQKAKEEVEELKDIDNLIVKANTEADQWKKIVEKEEENLIPLNTIKTKTESHYKDLTRDIKKYEFRFNSNDCKNTVKATIEPCKTIIDTLKNWRVEEPLAKRKSEEAFENHKKVEDNYNLLLSNQTNADTKVSMLQLKKENLDANLNLAERNLKLQESIKEIKEKPLLAKRAILQKAEEDLANATLAKTEAEEKLKTFAFGESSEAEAFGAQNDAKQTMDSLEDQKKNAQSVVKEKQNKLEAMNTQVDTLQKIYDDKINSKAKVHIEAIVVPIAVVVIIGIIAVVVIVLRKQRKAPKKDKQEKSKAVPSEATDKLPRSSKRGFWKKKENKSKPTSVSFSSLEKNKDLKKELELTEKAPKDKFEVKQRYTMDSLPAKYKAAVMKNITKNLEDIKEIVLYHNKFMHCHLPFGKMYIHIEGDIARREFSAENFNIKGDWDNGEEYEIPAPTAKKSATEKKEKDYFEIRACYEMFYAFHIKNEIPSMFKKLGRAGAGAEHEIRRNRNCIADGLARMRRWLKRQNERCLLEPAEEGDAPTYPTVRANLEMIEQKKKALQERGDAGLEDAVDQNVEVTQKTVTGAQPAEPEAGMVTATPIPNETTVRGDDPSVKQAEQPVEVTAQAPEQIPTIPTTATRTVRAAQTSKKKTKKSKRESRLSNKKNTKNKTHSKKKGKLADRDSKNSKNVETEERTDDSDRGKRSSEGSSSDSTRTTWAEKLSNITKIFTKPKPLTPQILDDLIVELISTLRNPTQMEWDYNRIIEILKLMEPLFESDKRMVERDLPITVVTDIHGNHEKMLQMIATFSKNGQAAWKFRKFVFCGDYVDRGENSLQVFLLLCLLKLRHPDNIVLIRGNHEDPECNKQYGFHKDLYNIFGKKRGATMIKQVNEVFARMPLCARLSEKIFCAHGGIVPDIANLKDINDIPSYLPHPTKNTLARQLLWGDPCQGMPGMSHNYGRGMMGKMYGEMRVRDFCDKHGIHMIVRGHQCAMFGYEFFAGERLVTLFTCPGYMNKPNHGATITIAKDGRYGIRKYIIVNGEQTYEQSLEALKEFYDQYSRNDYHHTLESFAKEKAEYFAKQARNKAQAERVKNGKEKNRQKVQPEPRASDPNEMSLTMIDDETTGFEDPDNPALIISSLS